MAHWLLKSDPDEYSFSDLERHKKAVWDGVTNNLALIHMRGMKKGDTAFIYHTGSEKCIVATAEITRDPYPDPKANNPKVVVVEVKPLQRLKKPVPLGELKSRKEFAGFALVRVGRLSVMPVTTDQWKSLLKMSE